MASKHRKRRRRIIKYAGIAAGTALAGYGLSRLFSGGDDAPGGEIAGPDAATETGGEGALAGPTVSQAGIFGMSPLVLIGIAAVAVLLWKK